jgi:hypothetical protein
MPLYCVLLNLYHLLVLPALVRVLVQLEKVLTAVVG